LDLTNFLKELGLTNLVGKDFFIFFPHRNPVGVVYYATWVI